MKYTNFKLKLRACLAILVLFVFAAAVNAQQTSISGIVKDASNGEPILGANILEKGTSNGTITNLDGQFTLKVAANATLIVRYIGFASVEVPVAGQKNIVIQIKEDAVALGEVVAIGYGVVKKNDATGSVTAIKPDKLNKGLTTSAQDMIVGKIAGVSVITGGGTPGGSSTIRIRGGSSLNASNDPLIVIDGLAVDNDGIKGVANQLSAINPNDIETFTVLKDASATAIYGSRASNGVILITTKKGEKGAKPRVSYDGNVTIGTVGKTLNVMNGDEFRAYAKQLYGVVGSANYNTTALSALGTANTDWQGQIYQTTFNHEHNLSISGGLKNAPYRVSFGYTNQDGIIKTSNFERYTGAISVSPSFFQDHLKVNLNAKGMIVNNKYVDAGQIIGSALAMDPTQAVTSTDPLYKNFGGYWQTTTNDPKIGITTNSLATKNPVGLLNQKNDVANAKDLIANAQFDYKFHFLPELHAHLNLGMDISTGNQNTNISTLSGTNNYYGNLNIQDQSKSNKSLSYFMQYAKELGEHRFDVMAGYEWQHFYREETWSNRGLQRVDANGLVTTDPTAGYYNPTSGAFKTESYLVSFFGRINYSYANKYLFTATLRDDATSRFSSKNRWGLFPAMAVAWKISEEGFMKDQSLFSDMKLRLGYGITGQQNLGTTIGDYPYIPVYATSQDGSSYWLNGKYVTTYRPNAFNENLKWEETTTYNAGLDLGLDKGRYTASIDYYHRVTKDLLAVVDIPVGTNFSNRVVSNVGSLSNDGLELSLNAKAISKKDFTWDIGYNVSYNRNNISKLTGNSSSFMVTDRNISSGTGNSVVYNAVSYPSNSFYVYEQVYDQNKKPIEGLFVDRNGDGKINDDDRYYYHNPAADILMGLSSKIIYKNWDFGFSMRASLGNYVYNDIASGYSNVGVSGVWSTSGFYANKITSEFKTNFVGKTNNYFSDYYIQNASFIRCDNITVGYSFKAQHSKFNGRVYATVQNPFVITKYAGLDPEVSNGMDNKIYPRPILTIVGMSLNF